MINRQKQIKEKGFSIYRAVPEDYSKIKVGKQTLEDAVIELGDLRKNSPNIVDKDKIIKSIAENDIPTLKKISNYFYKISGIYSRLCQYMATLYKYDWYVTPKIVSEKISDDLVLKKFAKALDFLDNFHVKQFFGEVALKVIRDGSYYGYVVDNDDTAYVQELPSSYCRSRFKVNLRPAIEFNMKFFDDQYRDSTQKQKVLNLFPAEFRKGYDLYKKGKLEPDFAGDQPCWYLLDPGKTIKFDNHGEEVPMFISCIPSIIDLNGAQELDRKKMAQQLLKIIIQKMPMDKNGELIFDVDEARQLHTNAVQMLGKAIGIDVLTTFADVDVANLSDNRTTTSQDELEKVERAIFNEAGTAQNLFNPDGNLSLDKSIQKDESAMRGLLLQFENFLNLLLNQAVGQPKKVVFNVQLLNTTIYNYKDLSDSYKGLMQLGLTSYLMPAIALGQSQSALISNARFEREILKLQDIMVAPVSSNNMSANANKTPSADTKKAGRPEKSDDQKSDKTIANRESMS